MSTDSLFNFMKSKPLSCWLSVSNYGANGCMNIFLLFSGAHVILDDDTDVGYVEDGTPCGPSMMCLDRKCLLIQALNMSSCPLDSKGKVCSGHGVSRHPRSSSNLYSLASSKFTVVRLAFQPFSFCICCQCLCTMIISRLSSSAKDNTHRYRDGFICVVCFITGYLYFPHCLYLAS